MPDNDLAAAVERLRRFSAGEAVDYYCDMHGCLAMWKVHEDRRIVANACLAREAELEKPVDREWLVSVLGHGVEEVMWSFDVPHYANRRHEIHLSGAGECRGYLECEESPYNATVSLKTRGDVLAFLRLADWPTNETKGGE